MSREMKDSGIKWIGEIPNEWQVRPVKAQYTLTTGFTPSSKNDSLYDDDGETWVTIADLKSDTIYDSKQKIASRFSQLSFFTVTKPLRFASSSSSRKLNSASSACPQ